MDEDGVGADARHEGQAIQRQMIQSFQTCATPLDWLKSCGQQPALWYSLMAQMRVRSSYLETR